jgi:hypothetical protein
MYQHEIIFCLFSDTHRLEEELEMPRASLYLCAGDFTMFSRSTEGVAKFNRWLGELGAPVVLTAGNHESFLEADLGKRSMLSNAHVLINESVEIAGLKIWGQSSHTALRHSVRPQLCRRSPPPPQHHP